jgi:hypothetical protein
MLKKWRILGGMRWNLGGTHFAGWMGVRAIAATMMASTIGYSGCLQSGPVVQDDAYLDYLNAPVIDEDDFTNSTPTPGQIVFLPRGQTTFTYKLHVVYDGTQPLVAHLWVDRSRPCQLQDGDCGAEHEPGLPTHAANSPDWEFGPEVVPNLSLSPPNASNVGTCHRIDFYVSTATGLGSDPEVQTTDSGSASGPNRPGNVAHARWIVVTRPLSATSFPDINSCWSTSLGTGSDAPPQPAP